MREFFLGWDLRLREPSTIIVRFFTFSFFSFFFLKIRGCDASSFVHGFLSNDKVIEF